MDVAQYILTIQLIITLFGFRFNFSYIIYKMYLRLLTCTLSRACLRICVNRLYYKNTSVRVSFLEDNCHSIYAVYLSLKKIFIALHLSYCVSIIDRFLNCVEGYVTRTH